MSIAIDARLFLDRDKPLSMTTCHSIRTATSEFATFKDSQSIYVTPSNQFAPILPGLLPGAVRRRTLTMFHP